MASARPASRLPVLHRRPEDAAEVRLLSEAPERAPPGDSLKRDYHKPQVADKTLSS